MPRKSRIDAPGALHHIIVRGIDRGKIFETDGDRDHFLSRLGGILTETKTACYAWGADTQSFSFTAKNQQRFHLYGHETAFDRLCALV